VRAKVRILILGGFLGSGKTTAVIALAKYFGRAGYRIAAVTNDHGDINFDAKTIRSASIEAREISEGCLCCRFNDFLYAADDILEKTEPDILLAEPVGTCLNLPRGLLLPLCRYTRERYDAGPLSVLVDPYRFRMVDQEFDPSVRYLFEQQLAEGDIIVINKGDLMTATESEEIQSEITERYPSAKTFIISALEGQGIEKWGDYLLETLWDEDIERSRADYDEYRLAESKLGYVDAALRWEPVGNLDEVAFVRGIIALLQGRLRECGIPVAHIKIAVASHGRGTRVNWTGGEEAEWHEFSPEPEWENRLSSTIRIQGDPEEAREIFESTVHEVAEVQKLDIEIESLQAFCPSPPPAAKKPIVTKIGTLEIPQKNTS